MMKDHVKAMAWLVMAGAALFVALGGASVQAAEPKPIVVGHLGEWTGPAGRTCGPVGDALIMYINEHLNKERGGIAYKDAKTGQSGKVKLKLIYADCRYELPLFKSAYRDFVDKGMVFCHTTSSPAAEGLKKDYKRDQIPCILSTGNTAALWPPEWAMGTRQTFADDVGLYVKWLKMNWKESRPMRIALMYYDGPFGRSILWGGPEYIKANGMEIVADEPVAPMPVDMSSQLLRIKAAKADWIIANCLGSQAAVILKDMKRLGITIPFSLCEDTDAQELLTLAGDAAEGAYFMTTLPTAWDEKTYSGVKWLNENYRKYMKGKAGYDVVNRPVPDAVWSAGWFIGHYVEVILQKTLELVSPDDITGKDVMEKGFFRLDNYQVAGMGYPPGVGLKYIPWKDHRGGHHASIHQIKGMKDSMATDFMEAPLILPPWMKEK
ncbi:MAG: ABC transporter substrate-binding protein [Proteobacteria bacterium]|nr:ABC transporter substrate-binding protein [Pseudomonadota bacterium]